MHWGRGGAPGWLLHGGGNTSLPLAEIREVGQAELLLRGYSGDGRQETLRGVGPAVTFARRKTLLSTMVRFNKRRKINRAPRELRKPVLA